MPTEGEGLKCRRTPGSLEPQGKGSPALRGVQAGRVSQPGGENREPLTLG